MICSTVSQRRSASGETGECVKGLVIEANEKPERPRREDGEG